jgi:hypothetical protein
MSAARPQVEDGGEEGSHRQNYVRVFNWHPLGELLLPIPAGFQ